MSDLTSGRGGGRNSGRGRGYAPAPVSKGANPLIGAFLTCGGRGPSANETTIWASKIKEFAMSHYETNIDNIFGPNGATGEYPEIEEPETPEDEADRVAFKIWEIAYSAKVKFDQKLAVEKTQLFGIMLGQMSDGSKDLIRETEIGRNAYEAKDPLMLLRGAIQTHMSDSRLGAEQSLHKTQNLYNQLRMENHENVSFFYQKMKSSLSALEEAHTRCDNNPEQRMDDEPQRSIKFIQGLSSQYNEFKSFFENKLIAYPVTLDEAFTEASTFRINRVDQQRYAQRIDVFSARGRSGRGGRGGRGKVTTAPDTSFKPICFNCGKEGHLKSNCRSNAVSTHEQDIARAVAAQRKEACSRTSK